MYLLYAKAVYQFSKYQNDLLNNLKINNLNRLLVISSYACLLHTVYY